MATISEMLAAAYQHQLAGQAEIATRLYQGILAIDPENVDALHLLAKLLHQREEHVIATQYVLRALNVDQNNASLYVTLGVLYTSQGNWQEALNCFHRSLVIDPGLMVAHYNIGAIFLNQDKLDEALHHFQRARELVPNSSVVLAKLALALKRRGNVNEAVTVCREALDCAPNDGEVCETMGSLLIMQNRLSEAVSFLERAAELRPDHPNTHAKLGYAYDLTRQSTAARTSYERALELNPADVEIRTNLGSLLRFQGFLDAATAQLAQAIAIDPTCAIAHNNLGNALKDQGQVIEALACYRRALLIVPNYTEAHDNLICTLQYEENTTLTKVFAEQQKYEQIHASHFGQKSYPFANARPSDRRLRIGFVSGDFSCHPVGYLIEPLLANLDRASVFKICYSSSPLTDTLTTSIQQSCDLWRNVCRLNDDELADMIRADQVDILIDLSGHTAGNRLLTFSRRPAPVQISWVGGVGPAGLTAIEYFIADRVLVPDCLLPAYHQHVLRLPHVWCFRPPQNAPNIEPLPAEKCGYVTFASMNNPAKVTPQVVSTWARILHRVPGARLLMKYRGLNSPSVKNRYQAMFAAKGVDPARIDIQGESPFEEMLALYSSTVDIALDPFPFNGGMTTLLALYMGVPVITCPGETVASRQSSAVLAAIGLSELASADVAGYVDGAVRLANNLPALSLIRSQLRTQIVQSPLCDEKRFAQDFLRELKNTWEAWVRANPA